LRRAPVRKAASCSSWKSVVAIALHMPCGIRDEENSAEWLWPSRRLLQANIYDSGGSRIWRQYHEKWNECCRLHLSPVECLGSLAALVSSVLEIKTVILPQVGRVLSCPGGLYLRAQRVDVPALLYIVVGGSFPSRGPCSVIRHKGTRTSGFPCSCFSATLCLFLSEKAPNLWFHTPLPPHYFIRTVVFTSLPLHP
jgi:hypothetical protein